MESTSATTEKLKKMKYAPQVYTVFPHIVSAETILFWIWKSKGHST